METTYKQLGSLNSLNEVRTGKLEQRAGRPTGPPAAQLRQDAWITQKPTRRGSLAVLTGMPAFNTNRDSDLHPALGALARLLARQAAAELSQEPATALGGEPA